MERRAFIGVIAGGLLGAPLAAGAQQAGKGEELLMSKNALEPRALEGWAV